MRRYTASSILAASREYLRRHPEGAYVTETLEHVLEYLTYLNSWGPWYLAL